MADDQTDLPPAGAGLRHKAERAAGERGALGDRVGPALSYDSDDLLTARRGHFAARAVAPDAAGLAAAIAPSGALDSASTNGHQDVVFGGAQLASPSVDEPVAELMDEVPAAAPVAEEAADAAVATETPAADVPGAADAGDGLAMPVAETVATADPDTSPASAIDVAPYGLLSEAGGVNGHAAETVEFTPAAETAVATLPVAEPAGVMAPPPAEPPAPPSDASLPPPSAPPPDEEEEDGATMTIIEHLEELRRRMFVSAVSVVLGAVVGWFFVPWVLDYLQSYATGVQFVSLTVLGPLALKIKLAFLIGLILGSPMVLYQIWAFVAPGLTRRERRYALPFSLLGSALFASGAVSGVLVVPLAIRFLLLFFPQLHLGEFIDINGYVMFIALIAVIFGITFELPIFMVGFSLLGVVNSRFFIQKFRVAIFIMYGAAMVITPGVDFISPLILGTVLTGLYWVGVFLIRWIGR